MIVKVEQPEAFAKRMFFLLWQAIGGPMGMGVFQNRPGATEEDVFENVQTSGDYACNVNPRGDLYGDYVFGRMMKFGCAVLEDRIKLPDRDFQPDYQGFYATYPNNLSIVKATAESLGVKYEIEETKT